MISDDVDDKLTNIRHLKVMNPKEPIQVAQALAGLCVWIFGADQSTVCIVGHLACDKQLASDAHRVSILWRWWQARLKFSFVHE